MKSVRVVRALVVAAVLLVVGVIGPVQSSHASTALPVCRPVLSATFLQPSYPVFGWTRARYDSELTSMTAVGISTVVLQWSVDMDAGQAYYPAPAGGYARGTDMVTPLLASAAAHGAKVWLGLGNVYAWQAHATDRTWLSAQLATDERIADQLWSLFGYRVAGWYVSNEVDDYLLSQPASAANIQWFFTTLSNYLHTHDGRLKVMTAPTYSGLNQSTAQFAASARQAMGSVDVLDVQDGGGSGYIAAADINRWFTALRDAFAGTRTVLWQDADLYGLGGPMPPAQLQGDLSATCGLVVSRSGFSFTTQLGPLDLGTSLYYDAYAAFRTTVLAV